MSVHPPPVEILDRVVVIDGRAHYAEKLSPVFFAANGQIVDNAGHDYTRDYLDYMYKLTNGNLDCVLRSALLDNEYKTDVDKLVAGFSKNTSPFLNYKLPILQNVSENQTTVKNRIIGDL